MGALILAIFTLLMQIPMVMLRGFVLSKLWLWFLVPLGVPAIGVALAIGIIVLVNLLTSDPNAAKDDDDKEPGAQIVGRMVTSVMMSLMAWGIGAIVASFL